MLCHASVVVTITKEATEPLVSFREKASPGGLYHVFVLKILTLGFVGSRVEIQSERCSPPPSLSSICGTERGTGM